MKYFIIAGLIFTGAIEPSFIQKNTEEQYSDNANQEKVTVDGFISIHKPYCGGASPTPEMERGTFSPFANSCFSVVLKDDTSRTAVQHFQTNKNGYFKTELIAGEYSIFSQNKMQPFKEFAKNNNGDGHRLISLGQDCLKEWYDTPDFSLNTEKDTTVRIFFYSGCYTGINPCLQYTGPLPP